MGACSAKMAAVVPVYSGVGAEARATTALFSENNKQAALSASVILRMYSPEYSIFYAFKLSEWSKNYQTITSEADDGKTILNINPGKMRDITEGITRQKPSLRERGFVSKHLHYSSKRLCNTLDVVGV